MSEITGHTLHVGMPLWLVGFNVGDARRPESCISKSQCTLNQIYVFQFSGCGVSTSISTGSHGCVCTVFLIAGYASLPGFVFLVTQELLALEALCALLAGLESRGGEKAGAGVEKQLRACVPGILQVLR